MLYRIEQRIFTLVDNAVIQDDRMAAAFSIGTMRFSHWDFDIHNAWVSDLWLAEGSVDAASLQEAVGLFRQGLARITPRISFIGQSYIEYATEPWSQLPSTWWRRCWRSLFCARCGRRYSRQKPPPRRWLRRKVLPEANFSGSFRFTSSRRASRSYWRAVGDCYRHL